MNNVYVKKVDLPVTVGAYTIKDKNDDYTVFLNERRNYENQLEAYLHELNHIKNGDFYKEGSVDVIEKSTH